MLPRFASPWLPCSRLELRLERPPQHHGRNPRKVGKRDRLGLHVHLRPSVFVSSSSLDATHEALRYSSHLETMRQQADAERQKTLFRFFVSLYECPNQLQNYWGQFLLRLCGIYRSIRRKTNIFFFFTFWNFSSMTHLFSYLGPLYTLFIRFYSFPCMCL